MPDIVSEDMITIERLSQATESAVEGINRLLPQLRESPTEHTTTLAELTDILSNSNTMFLTIIDDGQVIGMATLYMITKLSKRSGFVEDVVVDSAYRGQGLGEKLIAALVDAARVAGLKTLHLTSRPERVAANKLYQKLGFKQKETNVYKMTLT
jgi:ribosomal protein S18 acetylase RimI-like enzyme